WRDQLPRRLIEWLHLWTGEVRLDSHTPFADRGRELGTGHEHQAPLGLLKGPRAAWTPFARERLLAVQKMGHLLQPDCVAIPPRLVSRRERREIGARQTLRERGLVERRAAPDDRGATPVFDHNPQIPLLNVAQPLPKLDERPRRIVAQLRLELLAPALALGPPPRQAAIVRRLALLPAA